MDNIYSMLYNTKDYQHIFILSQDIELYAIIVQQEIRLKLLNNHA